MKRCWLMFGAMALLGMAVAVVSTLAEGEGGAAPARTRGRRTGGPAGRGGPGGPGGGAFVSLNISGLQAVTDLTQEQKDEIAKLQKAAVEKANAVRKQLEDDVKKVLTPEQVKKLEAAAGASRNRGVTLTEDQQRVIDDARKAAEGKTPEERMKLIREAWEKVRATFTDEQKKQEEAGRAGRGGPGGRTGGRTGGNTGGGGTRE